MVENKELFFLAIVAFGATIAYGMDSSYKKQLIKAGGYGGITGGGLFCGTRKLAGHSLIDRDSFGLLITSVGVGIVGGILIYAIQERKKQSLPTNSKGQFSWSPEDPKCPASVRIWIE